MTDLTLLFPDRDWHELARCRDVDPELWWPNLGQPGREAKRICAGCEVQSRCLEWALDHNEQYGIWGGLTPQERREYRRRRRAS